MESGMAISANTLPRGAPYQSQGIDRKNQLDAQFYGVYDSVIETANTKGHEMTPQDSIYWVPIFFGLFMIFGIVVPFLGFKLMDAHPACFVFTLASGALFCIPIIQWFALAGAGYLIFHLSRKK